MTNRTDLTSELVEKELYGIEQDFIRLNTEESGDSFQIECSARKNHLEVLIRTSDRTINGIEIGSIWLRRPMPPEPAAAIEEPDARKFAQSELRSLLDGALLSLDCTWVSHPEKIRLASHKLLQLKVASKCGFTVPETLVSADPLLIRSFDEKNRSEGARTIAKLISQGPPHQDEPEKQYTVFSSIVDQDDLASDLALSCCPAIYQRYVEKKYELRVTVVGNQCFACEIHSQASEQTRVDWRRYDIPNTPHLPHLMKPDIEKKCLAITRALGLSFSTIDLVVQPDDSVVFLELNPNGQWGWIEELTGMPIAQSIAVLLSNKHQR